MGWGGVGKTFEIHTNYLHMVPKISPFLDTRSLKENSLSLPDSKEKIRKVVSMCAF